MNPLSFLLPWAAINAFAFEFCAVSAFSTNNDNINNNAPIPATSRSTQQQSRTEFLTDALAKGGSLAALALVGSSTITPRPAFAAANADADIKPKLTGISDAELKRIIASDVAEKQFLVSADLTREVYDEAANFIDEIDAEVDRRDEAAVRGGKVASQSRRRRGRVEG